MATAISIEQTLSKALRSIPIAGTELVRFYELTKAFLHELDASQNEEHNKRLVGKLLEQSFYDGKNAVNSDNTIDLAIFADTVAKDSHPVVLFEVKKATNPEMVQRDDLNRKALHELVLYYVRQEQNHHNTAITHLIITDGVHWFVFDKRVFYDCFIARKSFANSVINADTENNKTQYIYDQIIRPYVATLGDQLRYTYLNLADVAGVSAEHAPHSRKVTSAYRLLSPPHLLKQPVMFDHNELSMAFYHELLYIMGLEEVMVDNLARIVRCKPNHRQPHSLLEETIRLFDERGALMSDEEKEEAALGLVMTWVNRLLFLKLLEAQLIGFGQKEKFLTPARIPDYSTLHDLFFQVLGHPVEERIAEMRGRFDDVPYLNSNLFEFASHESSNFRVRELRKGKMKVFKGTRLHDEERRRATRELPTLEYLLRFLDSYDFSGIPKSNDADDDAKTIIDAAVLGIIFEKINGYKDGAFFTPSYLSEFMCREVIQRTVVDKFNEAYKEEGLHFENYQDLKERLTVNQATRVRSNEIINSIHICDPSVGSGHFLVSALNELLFVKSELRCLEYIDEPGRRIKEYNFEIKDDELIVRDAEGIVNKYNPREWESHQLQKTLFEEKRILIENCLFGADINPKSAEICRLRLWIELLKNAYYENGRLQTLPNIDINIKCGNSLISKYPVRVGVGIINPDKPAYFAEYRQLVKDFKACNDKQQKSLMRKRIDEMTQGEMVLDAVYRCFFPQKEQKALIQTVVDWQLVFPEVLDDNGHFMGFDIVLGNPPYINMQSLPDMSNVYAGLISPSKNKERIPLYKTYSSTGDISTLFFERGMQLLSPKGYLCFITTNKWMRSDFGQATRQYLTTATNPLLLVDFPGQKLFAKATVETCILLLSADSNQHKLQACSTIKREKGLYTYVHEHLTSCDFNGIENWVIRNEKDWKILKKVQSKGKMLATYSMDIHFGLKTGRNDVFIVNDCKRQEILSHCQTEEECERTAGLFKPLVKGEDLKRYKISFADRWLIHTHNGIKDQETKEVIVPKIDIEDYPALKAYLDANSDKISNRTDQGDTYYNLRNCVYWPEFSKPKIMWGEISDKPKFCLDEGSSYYTEATTFFMTGEHLIYLLVYLNSPLSEYLFSKLGTTTGAGTLRWKKYKVEQQLVPDISSKDEQKIIDLYRQYQQTNDEAHLEEAYHIIYNVVGLTEEEVEHIESNES